VAVVGDAYIVVRALTNRVRQDIQDAVDGIDSIGDNAGKELSDGFNRGFRSGGAGGSGEFFSKKFEKEAEAARVKLNSLIQTGFFLGPALAGVAGGVGALGATLVSLVSVLGAASPALIVFGGALTSLVQGLATAKLAFAGVSKAIGAGLKAQAGSAKNTKAIEDATRRLEDAQRRLFRLQNEAKPELLAQLAERQRDAEEALADAKISSTRAERTYRDAQERTKKSIENLNKAREDAKEKIQQLRFEVEGGAISEKKARLEFEKARDSLQRVQDLPPNSRARQEAELAFAEADLNLRKAIDRNKDLKKEEKAATAAGVEGSQAVKDAKLAIRSATEGEADARIDAAKAIADVTKAETAAELAKNEALNDPTKSKAVRDINRQIADARRAVRDANDDLKETQKGGSGADAFADALKDLSPEAQSFVKYIVSLKGEFKKLRDAAGKDLFPLLEKAIGNLVTNLFPKLAPLLRGTGKALGEIAVEFSNTITEAGNLKNLETVWKNNDKFLKNLGTASGNLYGAFLSLLAAAGPLIDRFGKWLVTITETFEQTTKAKQATGELTDNFNKAGDVAARIGGILKNYFKGFQQIGKAVMEGGAGERLLKYFEDASKRFQDLMTSMNADGSLGKYFDKATENGLKVLDLLVNIVAEILKLGDDKGVGIFVDKLSEAVDIFGSVGADLTNASPALGDFVVNFAKLVKNLTDSGGINKFFGVLNKALEIVNKIFGNEVVKKVFVFTSGIFAVVRAFGLIGKVGAFFGKALIGNVLKITKVFKLLKDPFGALRKGSGLTRTELQKQMVIDKQKEFAMKGIFLSGKQAAAGLGQLTNASKVAKGSLAASGAAAQTAGNKFSIMGKMGKLSAVGANIGKTAVRGFGSAMNALGGPIGVILILLPFLIGFIKKLWEENETFRAVVERVMGFVKGAFEGLMNVVKAVWDFVKPIFELIGNAVKTYITTYVDGLKIAWGLIMKAVKAVWDFIKPIFELIGNGVKLYITTYIDLLKLAWEGIKTAVQAVWDFIKPIFELIGNGIKNAITFYVDALKKAWDLIKTAVQAVWDFVRPIFTKIGDGIKNSITFFINAAKTGWDNFKNNVQAVWDFIRPIITKIGDAIRNTIGGAVDKIKGVFETLKGVFKSVFNFLANAWNATAGKLKFSVPGWVPGIGGKSFGIPTIPVLLAEGGIIPPTPGGTLARIGEAGRAERVEPLDPDGLSKRDKAIISMLSGGGGGTTINVYPSAGMNERELANLVSKQLAYQLRKGAA
jgi:phage-related protein